jgi:hypothetical protein
VGKPVDTFHSFVLMINKVITESNGSKAYGVCLTTYKIPSKKRMFQIDSLIGNWRSKNLASSDYEFAQHVLRQIAAEREKLLKLKVAGPDSGETPETKSAIEETILVLEELLVPLKSTVLVDAENSYEPVCLGVLSKWPWYNLLHDWLCLVVKNLQESGGSFPFERYAVNLVHEIPLPPPGKLELSIPFEHYTLYCSRPPLNSSPVIKNVSFINLV